MTSKLFDKISNGPINPEASASGRSASSLAKLSTDSVSDKLSRQVLEQFPFPVAWVTGMFWMQKAPLMPLTAPFIHTPHCCA